MNRPGLRPRSASRAPGPRAGERRKRAAGGPLFGFLTQTGQPARPLRGKGAMTERQAGIVRRGASVWEALRERSRRPSAGPPGAGDRAPGAHGNSGPAGFPHDREQELSGRDASRPQAGDPGRFRHRSVRDNCCYRERFLSTPEFRVSMANEFPTMLANENATALARAPSRRQGAWMLDPAGP